MPAAKLNLYDTLKVNLANQVNLTDEQWRYVSGLLRVKTLKRRELLLEKGKVCNYLFFVAKGCLRVFLTDEDGNESTRFLVFEGRFGTAFPSFTLLQPSAASIEAVEPSEVLMISYNDYQTLLDVPGWERIVRKGLEMDYIDAIVRIESLISMDAAERYRILMRTNPKLIQRLPNKIV